MDFQFCAHDMELAIKALQNSKLDIAVSGTLLCEVYCLTSLGYQSFYLQVYDGTEYTLLYAKPMIANQYGMISTSCSFSDAAAAETHLAGKGAIYCGIQKVSKEAPVIGMLLSCLPNKDEIAQSTGIVLDGVTTVIRNHCEEQKYTLLYRNVEDIFKNVYTTEQKGFLKNMHVSLETVIGKLRLK